MSTAAAPKGVELCLWTMAESFVEQARKIGFNQVVTRNSRTFVIQTEVQGHQPLMIRTTVLERGVVRLSNSSEVGDVLGRLEHVKALAVAQHGIYVGRVERGEVE